jgi:mannose-6-phosphate isomerase-like protein (cupin superfamily)
MRTILAAAFALTLTNLAQAAAAPAPHMPRGTATDIGNADVQAMAKRLSSQPGGDELLRVVSINNGEYNVGVAVVHRAKAPKLEASLEHSQITEIYHIISGSGTMVSEGTIENAKDASDPHTLSVVGPSSGGKFTGGRSRKIGAGDVVIVPPNTPHGWSEVSDELVYLVVRMDPKKVLKAN